MVTMSLRHLCEQIVRVKGQYHNDSCDGNFLRSSYAAHFLEYSEIDKRKPHEHRKQGLTLATLLPPHR